MDIQSEDLGLNLSKLGAVLGSTAKAGIQLPIKSIQLLSGAVVIKTFMMTQP